MTTYICWATNYGAYRKPMFPMEAINSWGLHDIEFEAKISMLSLRLDALTYRMQPIEFLVCFYNPVVQPKLQHTHHPPTLAGQSGVQEANPTLITDEVT